MSTYSCNWTNQGLVAWLHQLLGRTVALGLNMALAPAGRLPLYEDLEPETRQLCEDVILNSQKNDAALKKFMAFLNFRGMS